MIELFRRHILLVNAGADLTPDPEEGPVPLLMCALEKKSKIANFLVENGASVTNTIEFYRNANLAEEDIKFLEELLINK